MRNRFVVALAATVTVTIVTVAGAVVAGCSGISAQPATIPPTSAPPATLPPTTETDPTTTVAPDTSVPSTTLTTPTTVVSPGAVALSADGPWKLVDSAPGITSPGLVYELMPKLWVFLPTEESTDDGNLFVPAPTDIPIIEAYLNATLVYYRALSSHPANAVDGGWDSSYTASAAADFKRRAVALTERGEAVDLDQGVVLRPHIIGDGRTETEAVVADCTLNGASRRLINGDLAPGALPGVLPVGQLAQLVVESGIWKVDGVTTEDDLCV